MGSLVAYRFGAFEMRPGEHVLVTGGIRVPLTPKAYDLLRVLVQHRGAVVDKRTLMEMLWPETFVEEANLSVQVAAVRKALAAHAGGVFIETVAKRGYRFAAHVDSVEYVPAPGSSPGAPLRLTVLPLKPVGSEKDAEFLAFSFPDAIAGSLADYPWLVVRSPLAAGRGRTAPDLHALAASGADAVLEGTLSSARGGPRVRMSLLEATSGTVLLSAEFGVAAADLFELQSRIARDVARVLGERMHIPQPSPAHPAMLTTPAAYVFYLRATQLAYETSQWAQALELYEACVREDPGYAPAWARLARCHRVMAKFGCVAAGRSRAPRRSLERAEAAFEHALALDPSLPLTHSLYAQLEVDLGRAEDAMRRLLALAARRPHAPELFGGLVPALRFCGLLDQSVAAHRRARALDASIPTSIHHTWWMKGEYAHALAETLGDIGYMPGLALASLGSTREAVAALQWRERESPDTSVAVYIASLRALLQGRPEESRRALNLAAAQPIDPEARYYLARTYARLGDAERALTEMTRVVDEGFSSHETFARDPWLASVRDDVRFATLQARARTRSLHAARTYEAAQGPLLLGV